MYVWTEAGPQKPPRVRSGFAKDWQWICNGFASLTPQLRQPFQPPQPHRFAMDLQWIYNGFTVDLL